MTEPEDYSKELPRTELSRRKARSTVLFLVAMLAVALFIGFVFNLGPETPVEQVLSDVGDFPGDHAWFNTSRPLSLYDQLSRHVVVLFFCRLNTLSDLEYFSRLEEIQNEFREQPLAVIAVLRTDSRSASNLQNTINDWGIDFPVIIDHTGAVSDRFSVSASPALIVLDARARISARFFMGWDKADLRGIVNDLLQQLRAMRYHDTVIFNPDGGNYVPDSFHADPESN